MQYDTANQRISIVEEIVEGTSRNFYREAFFYADVSDTDLV